jgi:hypothetical protein
MENTRFIEKDEHFYIEGNSLKCFVKNEQDALDLVAGCGEFGTDKLLLYAENFSIDFFRLRTGLAGIILQKFVNYHIRVAAVIPLEFVNQGHFQDMVLEANRGNQFRVFQVREEAEKWLIEG